MNDMNPVLEKMRDHLIAKNVATDIAAKLCDSVAAKLEGKVLGATNQTINHTIFIYHKYFQELLTLWLQLLRILLRIHWYKF